MIMMMMMMMMEPATSGVRVRLHKPRRPRTINDEDDK